VVHIEIIGNDPEQLRSYYGDLFGWEFDTPSPVAQEVRIRVMGPATSPTALSSVTSRIPKAP
jgi:predicted enzyme related to lactoylglutathione lyase